VLILPARGAAIAQEALVDDQMSEESGGGEEEDDPDDDQDPRRDVGELRADERGREQDEPDQRSGRGSSASSARSVGALPRSRTSG
jgi:hypothetical protein